MIEDTEHLVSWLSPLTGSIYRIVPPPAQPATQVSPGAAQQGGRGGLQGLGRWQEVGAVHLLLLHSGPLHRKIKLHQKAAHENGEV